MVASTGAAGDAPDDGGAAPLAGGEPRRGRPPGGDGAHLRFFAWRVAAKNCRAALQAAVSQVWNRRARPAPFGPSLGFGRSAGYKPAAPACLVAGRQQIENLRCAGESDAHHIAQNCILLYRGFEIRLAGQVPTRCPRLIALPSATQHDGRLKICATTATSSKNLRCARHGAGPVSRFALLRGARQTGRAMSKRFYITTAIDYVNGQPHLGHAYEKVVADVIARESSQPGGRGFLPDRDWMSTGRRCDKGGNGGGRDGRRALRRGRCISGGVCRPRSMLRTMISSDGTQPRHKEGSCRRCSTSCTHQGELYKAPYRGLYSSRQGETFLTEKDRRADGTFDPIYGEVVELVEENWYFRMSRYQNWMMEGIWRSHPGIRAASEPHATRCWASWKRPSRSTTSASAGRFERLSWGPRAAVRSRLCCSAERAQSNKNRAVSSKHFKPAAVQSAVSAMAASRRDRTSHSAHPVDAGRGNDGATARRLCRIAADPYHP